MHSLYFIIQREDRLGLPHLASQGTRLLLSLPPLPSLPQLAYQFKNIKMFGYIVSLLLDCILYILPL